jgi:hypothetical protein
MRDSEIVDITYDHTIPDHHIQVTIHLSEALEDGMMVMQVVVPESWMVGFNVNLPLPFLFCFSLL